MLNYSFVVDEENKPLAPTKSNKAWFLIRKLKEERKILKRDILQ